MNRPGAFYIRFTKSKIHFAKGYDPVAGLSDSLRTVFNGLPRRGQTYFLERFAQESQVDDLFGDVAEPVSPESLFQETLAIFGKQRTSEEKGALKPKSKVNPLVEAENSIALSKSEKSKLVTPDDDLFLRRRRAGERKAHQRRVRAYKVAKQRQNTEKRKERAREKVKKEEPPVPIGVLEWRANNSRKTTSGRAKARVQLKEHVANRKEQVKQSVEHSAQRRKDKKLRKMANRAAKKGNLKSESKEYLAFTSILEKVDKSALNTLASGVSLMFFLHQLRAAKTVVDYSAATFQFVKANSTLPVARIAELATTFAKDTFAFFRELVAPKLVSEGSWLSGFEPELLTEFIEVPIFKAFRKIIVSLLGYKFFSDEHSSRLTALFGSAHRMPLIDFFQHCVEFSVKVISVVKDVYNGVPLSQALLATDGVKEITKNIQDVLVYENFLYTGLPVEGSMEINDFIVKLRSHIEVGSDLLKKANPFKTSTDALRFEVLRGTKALNFARNRVFARKRMTPIGVVLHGDPQVGKGHVLPLFAQWFAELKGREFEETHIFNRATTSAYWEGYDPVSQKYIHYSEVGNLSLDFVKKKGDESLAEINKLVDSLPFNCDMAGVDLKGKVYAQPDMVLIDTNNEGMHIDHLMSNPAAIRRRFVYIEQIVKPQFRKDDGRCGIDFKKSIASDAHFLDKWYFTVKVHDPLDSKRSSVKILKNRATIFELREWFREYATNYILEYETTKAQIDASDLDQEHIAQEESGEYLHRATFVAKSCNFAKMAGSSFVSAVSSGLAWMAISSFLNLSKDQGQAGFFSWSWTRTLIMGFLFLLVSLNVPNMWTFFPCVALMNVNLNWFIAFFMRRTLEKQRELHLHRAKCYGKHLSYLFGFTENMFCQDAPPHITQWQSALKTLLLVITAIVAFRALTKKKSERKIKFEADVHERIGQMQLRYHCGDSYKRIPNKIEHQLWNTRIYKNIPSYTGTSADFMRVIGSNIRAALVTQGTSSMETHVFGLRGDIAMINSHCLRSYPLTISVSTDGTFGNGRVVHPTNVREEDVIHLGRDISLVRLNGVRFKNHVKHFCEERVMEGGRNGRIMKDSVRVLFSKDTVTTNSTTFTGYAAYRWEGHRRGMCGLPLICEFGQGWLIVGFHCAGSASDDLSFATTVSKSELETKLAALESASSLMPVLSESDEYLSFVTEDPIEKSPFRFLHLGGLNYFGKMKGPVLANGKSRLVRSKPGCELLTFLNEEGHFSSKQFGRPVMRPRKMQNGDYLSPYNIGLEKMSCQRGMLDRKLLALIADKLCERIVAGLRDKNVPQLRPLTLHSAINGAPEDPFIRRITASTAAGFGFQGKKENYLPLVDEITRSTTEDLAIRVEELLCSYNEEQCNGNVFGAKLKDEPRPMEKVVAGKTRLFFAQSLDALIVQRMFLCPFYSLMVQFNDLFCTAVGINMHSGADRLVDRLRNFSTMYMEGDYSAYDQTMPCEVGHTVNTVVLRVLKVMGYNDSALRVVNGILSDSMFPVVEMLQDVFEVPGLQPSGKYATAEDNSLRSLVMLMYAWYSNDALASKDFFSHCLPVTYGDDMLVAVKEEVMPLYNNLTYAQICEEVYRMRFTSAEKDEELTPYKEFHQLSFLKRTFRYDEKLKHWKAPLSMDSILKALEWRIPSSFVTEEEQFVSTCQSVLWELFFHLSESEFTGIRERFVRVIVQYYEIPEAEVEGSLPKWEKIAITLGW